jgi:hypothetical protein
MMQQPMGLQSLLQRQRSAETQKNMPLLSGMDKMIQLTQALQNESAPVTPDGRPTIAALIERAAIQMAMSQGMQPGMPPQGGMTVPNPQMQPQNPGTVAQAAQAAAMAGQQQQAQQQQAMQAAMQMAQQQQGQQPQGMARGGLASLRADNIARMKYAQGGVIGYATRGYVDPMGAGTAAPEDEDDSAAKPKRSAAFAMPFAAAVDIAQLPLNALRKLIAAEGSDVSITPTADALRRWEQAKETPEAARPTYNPALEDARRREDIPPSGIATAIRGTPAPAPAAPRPVVPQVAQATPAAAPAAPAPVSFEDIMKTVQRMTPQDPAIAEMLARQKKKEVLEAGRPAFEEQGIAALQAAEEARKKQLEQQRGGDTLRRITGFANLLYKKDLNALERVDDLIALREKESTAAELATAQMQTKMREAAYQRKIGNEDDAMKLFQEAAKLNEARLGHQANLVSASSQLQAAREGSAERLQATRETNAAHLQAARISHAAAAMGTPEMRMAEWIKDPKNLAAYQTLINAKGEPGLIRELTKQAVSNPAMLEVLKTNNPQLYAQIMAEISSSGVASSVPKGAQVRQ